MLNQADLYKGIKDRLYDEMIWYQGIMAMQSVDFVDNFQALINMHCEHIATIISEEVDKFVRSADIKPSMMDVQSMTIQTQGSSSSQSGPTADTPLKADSNLTLGQMN